VVSNSSLKPRFSLYSLSPVVFATSLRLGGFVKFSLIISRAAMTFSLSDFFFRKSGRFCLEVACACTERTSSSNVFERRKRSFKVWSYGQCKIWWITYSISGRKVPHESERIVLLPLMMSSLNRAIVSSPPCVNRMKASLGNWIPKVSIVALLFSRTISKPFEYIRLW
jgi:hypothetical protein